MVGAADVARTAAADKGGPAGDGPGGVPGSGSFCCIWIRTFFECACVGGPVEMARWDACCPEPASRLPERQRREQGRIGQVPRLRSSLSAGSDA